MPDPIKTEDLSFKISSNIINQLGKELVSDDVTAIMELVKNAYDADASFVNIDISNDKIINEENLFFSTKGGYIRLSDSGFGMDLTDIKKGWLNISYSHKREKKKNSYRTPRFDRGPLGDKGLGRLSSQRLGDTIEIITSPKDEAVEYHIGIKWSNFADSELDVSDVKLKHSKRVLEKPKNEDDIHTQIIISSLREPVSDSKIESLKTSLSSTISNVGVENTNFEIGLKINGLEYDVNEMTEKILEKYVSKYSIDFDGIDLVTVRGDFKIDKFLANESKKDSDYFNELLKPDNGERFFKYLQEHFPGRVKSFVFKKDSNYPFQFERKINIRDIKLRLDTDPLAKEQNNIANPGKYFGELFEYSRTMTNYESKKELEIIRSSVGVKVYKNIVAIKPYGFSGNDWLNIGSAQTSGSSFYGLRPQNTRGYFYLDVYDNKGLEEKTDREGFVDNAYSQNFFKINQAIVLNYINTELGNIRRGYGQYKKTVDDNMINIDSPSPESNFERLVSFNHGVKNIIKESSLDEENLSLFNNSLKEVLSFAKGESEKLVEDVSSQIKKLIEFEEKLQSHYESYSDLEVLIRSVSNYIEDLNEQKSQLLELASLGLTTESLSHEINHILNQLNYQTHKLHQAVNDSNLDEVKDVTYSIESTISGLRKQLSHLNPSLKYIREKKENLNIIDFLRSTIDYYQFTKEDGISFRLVNSETLKININKGRLTQVFDNIILNSIYWLKRQLDLDEKIISFRINGSNVEIWDSGKGIDPILESSLFEPFTTMKPSSEGRGLGLFIITELLEAIGANIHLSFQRNKFDRRFKFILDFSNLTLTD